MGRRGPQPAPNVVKFAKGAKPSRINLDEPDLPQPTASSKRRPADLKGVGRREWDRLIVTLIDRGVLTEADLTAFADYCYALSDLRRYEQLARRVGAEKAILKGFANMCVKLRGQTNQLRAHLGLTPTSRASVRATKGRRSTSLERFHERHAPHEGKGRA